MPELEFPFPDYILPDDLAPDSIQRIKRKYSIVRNNCPNAEISTETAIKMVVGLIVAERERLKGITQLHHG